MNTSCRDFNTQFANKPNTRSTLNCHCHTVTVLTLSNHRIKIKVEIRGAKRNCCKQTMIIAHLHTLLHHFLDRVFCVTVDKFEFKNQVGFGIRG